MLSWIRTVTPSTYTGCFLAALHVVGIKNNTSCSKFIIQLVHTFLEHISMLGVYDLWWKMGKGK